MSIMSNREDMLEHSKVILDCIIIIFLIIIVCISMIKI